jgi:hypothetical protein
VHLINVSGHSQTGYFPNIAMRTIDVAVAGEFRQARSVQLGQALRASREGRYLRFTLPELGAYDVVVLE